MKKFFHAVYCALLVCFAPLVFASPPQTIGFQGFLESKADNSPVTGVVNVTFSLFGASIGGLSLWSETQTVTVTNGLYNVNLGTGTPVAASPPLGNLAFDAPYFLEVAVGVETLVPRIALATSPYAFRAIRAGSADALSASATVPVSQVVEHWREPRHGRPLEARRSRPFPIMPTCRPGSRPRPSSCRRPPRSVTSSRCRRRALADGRLRPERDRRSWVAM